MNEKNLKCLHCNGQEFETQEMPFLLETSNEFVVTPCLVCKNCGNNLMTSEQMDEFRKRADAYTIVHRK